MFGRETIRLGIGPHSSFYGYCILYLVLYFVLYIFGRPFVKRFALCYQSVVLFVCNVRALWPNG